MKNNKLFSKKWIYIITFFICLSFSGICCKSFNTVNEIDVVSKDFTPLHIETLAESIPPNSSFESNTFAWYQEDATASTLFPTSNLYMDDRYFYFDCEDTDYLYQKFDQATGKHIGPFLKRNVDDLSFSLEKIRTPAPATFSTPLVGYAYNEEHEYKKEQWRIIAVEKTEDQQTILWEHIITHSGEWPDDETGWDGFIQYDDIIIYTTYTRNGNYRYLKNLITRALSKETGDVLWEVNNKVGFQCFYFPEEMESSILNKIDRYYYIFCEINDFGTYCSCQNLCVIDINTGEMEKQYEFGSTAEQPLLDSDGYLYRIWWDITEDKEEFLTKINLLNLDDTLLGSSQDIVRYDQIGATQETVVINSSSTTLSANDLETLIELWQIDNATGYSEIQADGTMVVILDNQYICHINVDDGMVINYWDTKKLLHEGCTCTNLSDCEQAFSTAVKITPNNLAIVFIDEVTHFTLPNEVIHNQKILALSLNSEE